MRTIKLSVDVADLLSRFFDKVLDYVEVAKRIKEEELKLILGEVKVEEDPKVVQLTVDLKKADLERQIASANAHKVISEHRAKKYSSRTQGSTQIKPTPTPTGEMKPIPSVKSDLKADASPVSEESHEAVVPPSRFGGPIKGLEKITGIKPSDSK